MSPQEPHWLQPLELAVDATLRSPGPSLESPILILPFC